MELKFSIQNANLTKYKKTIHKYDKTQEDKSDKIQMRQNRLWTKSRKTKSPNNQAK